MHNVAATSLNITQARPGGACLGSGTRFERLRARSFDFRGLDRRFNYSSSAIRVDRRKIEDWKQDAWEKGSGEGRVGRPAHRPPGGGAREATLWRC